MGPRLAAWVERAAGAPVIGVTRLTGAQVGWAFHEAYADAGGVVAEGRDARVCWRLLDLVGFLPAAGRESGATGDTMCATWRAHGRADLTPERARRHREDLLRRTLRG